MFTVYDSRESTIKSEGTIQSEPVTSTQVEVGCEEIYRG